MKDVRDFDISKEVFREIGPIDKQVYLRVCTMCGNEFNTTIRSKNVCSYLCRREHVRQHAVFYNRTKRLRNVNPRKCIVCGFSETTDMHRERGMIFVLCPNHHCMITRGITTLENLLGIEKITQE